MPAVTRNQMKNSKNINSVNVPIINLIKDVVHIRQCAKGPTMEGLIVNMEDNVSYQTYLDKERLRINRFNEQRPKRNIKTVNYAGMDMNSDDEGEICVFKPWFENGKIIEKMSKRQLSDVNELDDEDYVLEEEQDEKEQDKKEQDKKEQVCKRIWAKATQEKEEIIPRRTRKQINYAGMDMSDEDEGTVNISKRWFENGKVTYKWSKRSLSEVNEIDDEDYVPDMY